ncbi:twin-arginine translocase subunit TatC [Candidatus Woesearchaeota archaeon]|jgi:sec-independent protein translocase protein TatC|nr:twin-arginine translocase subunit TatC [Candidatus Woesearchaeota archaeon]
MSEELLTIKEHLKELKKRLKIILIAAVLVFFTGFIISEKLIIFLIDYFKLELYALSPLEFIRTQLVVSLYLTLAFLIPFILVQLYLFSKPIMKQQNKKIAIKYFTYSTALAIIGCLFGLLIFSKYSLDYFATLPPQISTLWGVYSAIIFVALSGFAFALTAQIIIIIPILVKSEIIDINTLKKSRGIVIILALTLSAILTSPDPITQILMSAPMYICFETGLFISRFQKNKEENLKPKILKPLTETNNIKELLKTTKTTKNKEELIKIYKKINYLYEEKTIQEKKEIYPELLKLYSKIKNN